VASVKPQADAAAPGRAAAASRQNGTVACHRCIVKERKAKEKEVAVKAEAIEEEERVAE
jgi:hypothetical protein